MVPYHSTVLNTASLSWPSPPPSPFEPTPIPPFPLSPTDHPGLPLASRGPSPAMVSDPSLLAREQQLAAMAASTAAADVDDIDDVDDGTSFDDAFDDTFREMFTLILP